LDSKHIFNPWGFSGPHAKHSLSTDASGFHMASGFISLISNRPNSPYMPVLQRKPAPIVSWRITGYFFDSKNSAIDIFRFNHKNGRI
jgi:hypothetical protein